MRFSFSVIAFVRCVLSLVSLINLIGYETVDKDVLFCYCCVFIILFFVKRKVIRSALQSQSPKWLLIGMS